MVSEVEISTPAVAVLHLAENRVGNCQPEDIVTDESCCSLRLPSECGGVGVSGEIPQTNNVFVHIKPLGSALPHADQSSSSMDDSYLLPFPAAAHLGSRDANASMLSQDSDSCCLGERSEAVENLGLTSYVDVFRPTEDLMTTIVKMKSRSASPVRPLSASARPVMDDAVMAEASLLLPVEPHPFSGKRSDSDTPCASGSSPKRPRKQLSPKRSEPRFFSMPTNEAPSALNFIRLAFVEPSYVDTSSDGSQQTDASDIPESAETSLIGFQDVSSVSSFMENKTPSPASANASDLQRGTEFVKVVKIKKPRQRKASSARSTPASTSQVLDVSRTESTPSLIAEGTSKSGTKSQPKSQARYAAGEYPMELLVREAFVLEGKPKEVCSVCLNSKYEPENDKRLLSCHGSCLRNFHLQCLPPTANPENVPADPATFTCVECISGFRRCFICEVDATGLVKCPVSACGRYYHFSCLMGQNAPEAAKLKPCPHHECHTCKISGRTLKAKHQAKDRILVACNKCPTAYHFNFMCSPADTTICPENPKLMICWRHGDEKVTAKRKSDVFGRATLKSKICFYCVGGKPTLYCSTCPFSAHHTCMDMEAMPEGPWQCMDCKKGSKPCLMDIVWYKCGTHRIWPAQIVPEAICPPNIQEKHPGGSVFPLRFLATAEYCYATSKEVLPFDTCDPAWKKGDKPQKFVTAMAHARALSQEIVGLKTKFVAETFEGVQPVYNKIKTNRAIPPARFGAQNKSNSAEDQEICNCDLKSANPCGLQSGCINRDIQYECHPKFCPAGDRCGNQRFRRKEYPSLERFYTANRGWALRALEDIPKGSLVVEYVGEIITMEERNRRVREKLETGNVNFYFLDLTEGRVIDAGPSGNLARFANHSCEANCISEKWIVEGDTRIGLMAIRNIANGEEITFDYRWEYENGVTSRECLCGAEKCRGKIGGKTYVPKNSSAAKKGAG